MPPTLPSVRAAFVPAPPRGTNIILGVWRTARACLAGLACAACIACHGGAAPVAPGEPIPAAPEIALDTMDVECNGLVTALAGYKACPNLGDGDRWSIDAWTERAQQDFAAGKKANPEPDAQRAIAAACRKATVSVTAATERCHNGPRPRL
jgi:hypothetical protein